MYLTHEQIAEQLKNISKTDMKQHIMFTLWHQLGAVTGFDKKIRWARNWRGTCCDTDKYNEADVFRLLKTDKHDISILMFRFSKKHNADDEICRCFDSFMRNNFKEMVHDVCVYKSLYKFIPEQIAKVVDKFKDEPLNTPEALAVIDKDSKRYSLIKAWYDAYVDIPNHKSKANEHMCRVSILEQYGNLITNVFKQSYDIIRDAVHEHNRITLKQKCDSICADILKTAFADSGVGVSIYPYSYDIKLKVGIDWNGFDFENINRDEFVVQYKIALNRYRLMERLEIIRTKLQFDNCVARRNYRVINDADIEVVFYIKKLQEEFPGETMAQWVKHKIGYPHHIVETKIKDDELTVIVSLEED